MCSNKGPEWESPLAGKECTRQGQHTGPWSMALQTGTRLHCFLQLQCTVGDQLSKGENQAQKVLLSAHSLLDQGFKQVLPEMLPLHLLKASARMQPAQTLKWTWHNSSHSTQGKNSKVREKIPKNSQVLRDFCMVFAFDMQEAYLILSAVQ